MISRRQLMVSASLLVAGCAVTDPRRGRSGFVAADGTRLSLDGATHRFTGANMYYGAYLGAEAPLGNRDRLKRELDALRALGVTNLRVLGASELSPLKNSLRPA